MSNIIYVGHGNESDRQIEIFELNDSKFSKANKAIDEKIKIELTKLKTNESQSSKIVNELNIDEKILQESLKFLENNKFGSKPLASNSYEALVHL